jgi:hypothetical protein
LLNGLQLLSTDYLKQFRAKHGSERDNLLRWRCSQAPAGPTLATLDALSTAPSYLLRGTLPGRTGTQTGGDLAPSANSKESAKAQEMLKSLRSGRVRVSDRLDGLMERRIHSLLRACTGTPSHSTYSVPGTCHMKGWERKKAQPCPLGASILVGRDRAAQWLCAHRTSSWPGGTQACACPEFVVRTAYGPSFFFNLCSFQAHLLPGGSLH